MKRAWITLALAATSVGSVFAQGKGEPPPPSLGKPPSYGDSGGPTGGMGLTTRLSPEPLRVLQQNLNTLNGIKDQLQKIASELTGFKWNAPETLYASTGLPSGRQDVDRLRGRVEEVGKTLSTLGVSITNLPNGGLDLVSFNTSVESVQALRKQLLGILEILQPTQTLLLKRITPAGRPQDVDRLRQISPEQKEALIGNIRKIVDELEKLVPIQSEIRQSVDRTR